MQLWIKEEEQWRQVGITGQLALIEAPHGRVDVGTPAVGALAAVIPFTENGAPRAALLAPSGAGVTLNGYPPLGVAVLEDRDEITIRGTPIYFSAHSPAEEVPFPQTDTETRCARCKRPLHAGDSAIRCPRCAAWHHEGALAAAPRQERCCWTYDPACGGCGRPRDAMLWTPEDDDAAAS